MRSSPHGRQSHNEERSASEEFPEELLRWLIVLRQQVAGAGARTHFPLAGRDHADAKLPVSFALTIVGAVPNRILVANIFRDLLANFYNFRGGVGKVRLATGIAGQFFEDSRVLVGALGIKQPDGVNGDARGLRHAKNLGELLLAVVIASIANQQ